MNLIRFAKATTIAAALVSASQIHAAPLSYGTYYDETVPLSECLSGAGTSCQINFSQTPTNKLVLVTTVSCHMTSSKQPYEAILTISPTYGGGSLGRAQYFDFNPPLASAIGFYAGSFTKSTQLLVGPGRYPFVSFSFNGNQSNGSASCTLVGQLIDPL